EDAQTPIHDNDGKLSGSVIVRHDVSQAQATADKMTHLAQHDFLTQLPNRMLLDDRIAQGIEQAKRHSRALALIFVDLDNFKTINDSLGHTVGDRLLKSVADRLQSCVRSSDTVSRTGGDEFIVLLTEVQGERNAAGTAKKILQAMALEHDIENLALTITCSLGISLYPRDGQSSDVLVCHADRAMYQAKQAGRNRYQFFRADEQLQEVSAKNSADCR
ncbi:MAG: sensor domain-containing diguanylate cyclase, partial [Gammaproteobacteria bacterium HGW-Gammaproteobacteria-9]